MNKENTKVTNPKSHTKIKLKEKDSTPSSQDILSILVSTKSDHTFKKRGKTNKRQLG